MTGHCLGGERYELKKEGPRKGGKRKSSFNKSENRRIQAAALTETVM